MPGEPARLVLIRHGQSVATVERLAGGEQGCQGLSPLGHGQALALAARVRRSGELEGAVALVSSTLPRAIETARPLASVLGLTVSEERDLCEMHPGEGDGLSWDQWEQRYGSFDLGDEPDRPLSPGGESLRSFAQRTRAALRALVAEHRGTTVVATHGGVVEQSMFLGLGRADDARPGANLALVRNTSITEWNVDSDGGWTLVRFNDAAHLTTDGRPAE